jgi:hypothetical protein
MEHNRQGVREGAFSRWPARVRLLAADLLAFDARRLNWALAARGMAGLLVPLLLAHALSWPDLVWSGIGAFLLAIGARHLAAAMGHSPQARHHSRVLPHPGAIREALRSGLPAHRLACFHPSGDGAVERALCQLWGIDTILCRQSGSRAEALWLRISEELGLRLLLLARPPEPEGVVRLPLAELIARVGWPGEG